MEHVEENFAPACLALDFNNGIKRDQRDAKIRGVRRYAALAPAQYGGQPVVAATGVAARARTAFVAGAGDVVEVGAARSLHEIAADRCSIAKLRGGSGQERLSNRRKAPRKIAIVGEIGIADQCANPHAAVGKVLDAVEVGKMADVDESTGLAHAALHQIKKVRAGGEIGSARLCGRRDGLANRRRSDILETFHATSFRLAASRAFCASSTAWVIP